MMLDKNFKVRTCEYLALPSGMPSVSSRDGKEIRYHENKIVRRYTDRVGNPWDMIVLYPEYIASCDDLAIRWILAALRDAYEQGIKDTHENFREAFK